ncbi:MAG: photosystem I reaction center subunit XII [Symploca sp. SIO1B1]|nr:photosystem I reaction center subunit XII [Symploca sp. SIO1C2]NER92424.1 photosystem I reaction center subunit XII [Symploca sp. SIO1B1]
MGKLTTSATLGLDAFEVEPLELRPNATEEDLQAVIRAVYRQVLGNQYVMESDRLSSAESQLRNGEITVRGFVREVAQSSLYQSLFFNGAYQYRFIELNYKHLLGRAPQDQAEISQHVQIYSEQGYEAEIDSYIDSSEYSQKFGEWVVPYPCGIRSQVGLKNEAFNRMFSLLRGPATNDSDSRPRLISSIAANLPTPIKAPAVGNGANYGNTGKRYSIAYSTSQAAARLNRFSKQEKVISYEQMTPFVQKIHRTGGKILSVTELA